MPLTALETRLRTLNFLQPRDWDLLHSLFKYEDKVADGELIVLEDQEMERIKIIIQGWAYRYKSFRDGRRQILNLLLPGDIIGFYTMMRNRSDYGVEALTPVTMFSIPAASLIEIFSKAPRLALVLSWIAGQSELLLDQQITRIGRRNAVERMAHLFVELFLRLRRSGCDEKTACNFPLTQTVLADTLGMSHIHANRCFKNLARKQTVRLVKGNIEVRDVKKLARTAKFDSSYLQQEGVPDQTENALDNLPT